MLKTEYHVARMDCSSEENMIRLKLEGLDEIKTLEFDLENRKLVIYHSNGGDEINRLLNELDLGSRHLGTTEYEGELDEDSNKAQSRLLWVVLTINFGFFLVEITAGLLSRSMGLLADSLDMFADATVYGLSLWAIGSTTGRKKAVARFSGSIQFVLAGLGIFEVIRRFVFVENIPDFKTMIVVSLLALAANSVCLYLLQRSKSEEAHMKASMIFTSNDVIINVGVILAGILVLITQTRYPDLIVSSIVFVIVVRGAIRMWNLGK